MSFGVGPFGSGPFGSSGSLPVLESYSKGKAKFERLSGGSLTGWSAVTGTAVTGYTEDVRSELQMSSLSVVDGFTIGQAGELSIDPAVGTAAWRQKVDGFTPQPTDQLHQNDRFEFSYDGNVIMQGVVTKVVDSHAAPNYFESGHLRTTTYTLVSVERAMLDRTAYYDVLPEESALVRLRRFLVVDATEVTAPANLDIVVPAKDFGSAKLIDLAREFSEATGYPLRPIPFLSSGDLYKVKVIQLTDYPAPHFDNAEEWCIAIDFTNDQPSAMTCQKDDIRFTSAQSAVSYASVRTSVFQTAVDRTGMDGVVPIGFQVPGRVDAFGTTTTVHRVSQSFADVYTCSIEVM